MNMREIKFRAWDNYNEKWLKDYDFNIRLDNGNIQKNLCAGTIGGIEINQFTGLKDKNGVDIYEGYIVRSQDVEGVVKMIDGAFDIYKDNTKQYYDDMRQVYFTESSMEVIGNIYENPELLQSN